MTNKLVVIINGRKVPKIKKILLYEMKFLVPNYICLQNPWLVGYRPQIPVLSVLCPQLNLLNPPRTKFLGTPLQWAVVMWMRQKGIVLWTLPIFFTLCFLFFELSLHCYKSYIKHILSFILLYSIMLFCQNVLCFPHCSTRSRQMEYVSTTHSCLCQIPYAKHTKIEVAYDMSSEGIAESN